jgi:hypothetical protein
MKISLPYIHAGIIAQTAIVVESHKLLLPVFVYGTVGFFVQKALLYRNRPTDAHVVYLILFVFFFVWLKMKATKI